MRFLRTMIAAAVLAAPLVTLTVPPTAWAAADDSSKDDAQILKDAQGKLKNKKFSGVQVAMQNGMDADRIRPTLCRQAGCAEECWQG